jgi:tetratricopeptide (TPR) repeat protein
VDVQILAVLPHAHYLAKKIEAFAELPDGSKEDLLQIPAWDFNWQGDYTYKTPVTIPRNSVLRMRVQFDNSTNNPHNPSSPPKRVQYGLQSSDEMAEVWFQVLTSSPADYNSLSKNLTRRMLADTIEYNQMLLRTNPKDAIALFQLGKAFLARGEYGQAETFLNHSVEVEPQAEALYHLGLLDEIQGRPQSAVKKYEEALKLNPDYHMAHNNLGLLWLQIGRYTEAIEHFRAAVRLAPSESIPQENLKLAEKLARESQHPK